MKIVEPSFKIIEDQLKKLTIPERIEQCGRICYKSESRITPDSAIPFCKKMVESGHWAVLEMATVHLAYSHHSDIPPSSFITCSKAAVGNQYIASGSIRAFMEVRREYRWLWNFLAEQYPLFFSAGDTPIGDVRFAYHEEIPDAHRRVAVKFIVNRAVSHELVRHRPCSFLQESQRYCRYEDEVVFIRPEWTYNGFEPHHREEWEIHMEECEAYYREKLKQGYSPQKARGGLPNDTKTEIIVYADFPEWKHIFTLRDHPAADPEMRRVMAPLHQEFKNRWPVFFNR